MIFHPICGERITLLNNNTTAARNLSDFNNGIVFSGDPLLANVPFQIIIQKKVYTWSGSLEFGITKCDPDYIDVPTNATDLKNGTWILSGSSVLKDGRSLLDIYSLNLNTVEEGDIVGVMRTDRDELLFSLNGEYKGIAAQNIPRRVFAVIDLYGQVAQASIILNGILDPVPQLAVNSTEQEMFDDSDNTEGSSSVSNMVLSFDTHGLAISQELDVINSSYSRDKIRFHLKSGSLTKISFNGRTAERLRPLDEFNNGVVMTHRPLYNGELFEIRIDRLVEKWSGSIEVGVTTHNPDCLEFPPTMTNLKTGTIMMSGCGILTNGKATMRDYGEYNLDELMVGDRIGMIRKSNGNLHYIINGLDQGCAAFNSPEPLWGVVDLYGRTVKVTIVDRDEREEQNLVTRRNTVLRNGHSLTNLNDIDDDHDNMLVFHPRCGAHTAVMNNNRTAYRPNSPEDFNNGVVLTQRPLKRTELFEVRLDKMVTKWAGSIEIGVTTHSPLDMEYPSTMTNIRSGTWMMTGNGVMHNGTTVIDDYGTNLDRLQVGDRVAVLVKENGALHFFVNGIDQGEAASNLPYGLYGVIDLYGQAAQVTIIDYNLICCCNSHSEITFPPLLQNHIDLHFHHIHGKNVRICNGGRTALRPNAYAEFTDAVVISNRPLKNNEIFAIVVEKIIGRWSGSIEAGVTSIKPDDLELPATMTDLDHDIWMLSGSTVMQDGEMVKHGYPLNLDTLHVGTIIGMMRHNDGTLHFYLNGVDQGEACTGVPSVIYPVIDLYGQCAQVSIVSPPEHTSDMLLNNNNNNATQPVLNWTEEETSGSVLDNPCVVADNPQRCFYQSCGRNIRFRYNNTVAARETDHNHGIVFSNCPLKPDKLFEVRINKWSGKYAGCLSIGVTTTRPCKVPFPPMISSLKPDIWYLTGDEVWHNGRMIMSHYSHNLHWLQIDSTVGVKICSDNTLHFFINGQDQGIAGEHMPQDLYAVIDIYGSTTEIAITKEVIDTVTTAPHSTANHLITSLRESFISTTSSITQDHKDLVFDTLDDLKAERTTMDHYLLLNQNKKQSPGIENLPSAKDTILEWSFFSELRGRNIRLSNNNRTAVRIESYNQGVVIQSKPLPRDTLMQVVIEDLNPRWVSSLMIGILCHPLTRSALPLNVFGFKRDAWIIAGDSVYHNGNKIKPRYGPNLDTLIVGQRIGIMVDSFSQLKLFVDGVDQGVAASNIPPACFAVLDLYGQCEQVSLVNLESKSTVGGEIEVNVDVLPNNEPSRTDEISVEENFTACEKADLEHHEKESPSEEHTECHSKLNKTNENIMVLSCSSAISSTTSLEFESKSITPNENLSLSQFEQKQTAEVSHMSATNCDHKTSLNIANATYIQAEKSSGKSKNSCVMRSLTSSVPSLNVSSTYECPLVSYKANPNCEYRLNCIRLRSYLGIPVGFFSSDSSIICYCKSCCPNTGQESKGDPPCNYSVPVGWCKFPIKKHLMTNYVDSLILEKWHVAFKGTSFAAVRNVLDSGQLQTAGKSTFLTQKKSRIKDDTNAINQVVLSPIIDYASSPQFAPKFAYLDQNLKVRYECMAAFQVLIRPGSYKVGPPSCGSLTCELEQSFDLNSTEWVIKEKESTVLSAVLFKMNLINL